MRKTVHISRVYLHLILTVLVLSIGACRPVIFTSTPNMAIQATSIVSASPTSVPSLQETPIVTISKTTPPVSIFTKGTLPSEAGEYLLYSSDENSIEYVSLDGKTRGILITEQNSQWPAPNVNFRWIKADPSGFIFFTRQYSQANVYVGSSTVSVWRTDVFGNPLKGTSKLSIELGKDDNCTNPVISPRGHWMIIDCHSASRRYVLVVDVKAETIQKIDVHCESFLSTPELYVNSSIWSDDEMNFLYECGVAEYEFISLSNDTQVHKYIDWNIKNGGSGHINPNPSLYRRKGFGNTILSISPDWRKIALDIGEMPKKPDGSISGFQIFVTDLNDSLSKPDCSLNDPNCNQGAVYDLPFGEPYYPTENEGEPAFGLEWSHFGDSLMWTSYKSMGSIDLSTQKNHVFDRKSSGLLLGFSPDDHWMVFFGEDQNSNKYGLFAMNVENNMTHFLAEAKTKNKAADILFYGWLTIP